MPTIGVNLHYIRPYDEAELTVLCRKLDLNPDDFADVSLRRAGVLAMASAAISEPTRLSGASLRKALTTRWVQAGHDTRAREARRAIWNLMGRHILRDGRFLIELSELYAEFEGKFPTTTLKDQVGGPVRWEEDQLQPGSPSWGDVAAAEALDGIIKSRSVEFIKTPIRSTVLDALIDLSERTVLATQVERKLHFSRGPISPQPDTSGQSWARCLLKYHRERRLPFSNCVFRDPNTLN
jgi:hypothetical protein